MISYLGVDTGSTTVKVVLLDENQNILYKRYERHFSQIKETLYKILQDMESIIKDNKLEIAITGSGGMKLAEDLQIPFIQEVLAGSEAVKHYIPHANVAIELGGEDAKITFFEQVLDQKMNGSCAGGTGAFIDQMASLLETDASGLNEMAKNYNRLYAIASRCGVFAKTDVQPLLNEGAKKEDVAASIFQAVVNQTITGLAQGKKIRGNVAFLGGPLYFLSELRQRFKETLNLKDEEVLIPENSQYYVAIGTALNLMGLKTKVLSYSEFMNNYFMMINKKVASDVEKTDPLFKSDAEYKSFLERHKSAKVSRKNIEDYEGDAYLGIDAGSTTTKMVLLDKENSILYSFYGSNRGNPIRVVREELEKIYKLMGDKIKIRRSAVTGYGEALIKNAFALDIGEVETVAHYKAAKYFNPNVDFVIDIGGQDMKSFKINNGIIESIMLNEACSSGCGSFIETFAKSLNIQVEEFSKRGLGAQAPVDLGTRCTVFMNSRIKQVQKEGVSIEDLSAGLSISVVKNALYKVIRVRNPDELGKNIVVQGGTFLNDSVLRAFEMLLEREVVRPEISGLMGAFGCALLARERAKGESSYSTIIGKEKLISFVHDSTTTRCKLCTNNCLMTINKFGDNRKYTSGNRCERPLGKNMSENKIPNLFEYKYDRTFEYYKPLDEKEAVRGEIGIPRALNMYENYPLWFTIFTNLGFKIVLSDKSTNELFVKGMDSIASDTICYPAKMTNGHVKNLIEKGTKTIFYPCIPYNIKEDKNATNHYNCPIVNSYPEVLDANIDELKDRNYLFPYLPIYDKKILTEKIYEIFGVDYGIKKSEMKKAVEDGFDELYNYKRDIQKAGEDALEFAEKNNLRAVILAGRVYHLDAETHHGIPDLLNSFNLVVLTEDSIAHLGEIKKPLHVVDQWTYHSRLYKAASFVAKEKNVELIQLNSFGCGLDAITTDEVRRILEESNKIYTLLKIDEITNLGAVKIRIRSLLASMDEKERSGADFSANIVSDKPRVVFTKEMKKTHKLLIPQMAPFQFQFLEMALNIAGYNTEILQNENKNIAEEGLKYIHNDACYPSILVVGQFIDALKSGKYDLDKVALMISQTGGGCRATNYISFLRKALKDNNLEHIPVVSFNVAGLEKNPGFKLSPKILKDFLHGLLYGDLLMRLVYKTRPYEKNQGDTDRKYEEWINNLKSSITDGESKRAFDDNIRAIIRDFENIEIIDVNKPKVGIVGEILVKFQPLANNYLVDFLEKEGAEVSVPELYDFLLYTLQVGKLEYQNYKKNLKRNIFSSFALKYLQDYRGVVIKELEKTRFRAPKRIEDMEKLTKGYISSLNNMGEGWLLTAEMLHLIEDGVENIVCVQPFGCLPNHVSGKGMIKKIRDKIPNANIMSIDYDPGSSEVNQINRIRLMLSNARVL